MYEFQYFLKIRIDFCIFSNKIVFSVYYMHILSSLTECSLNYLESKKMVVNCLLIILWLTFIDLESPMVHYVKDPFLYDVL